MRDIRTGDITASFVGDSAMLACAVTSDHLARLSVEFKIGVVRDRPVSVDDAIYLRRQGRDVCIDPRLQDFIELLVLGSDLLAQLSDVSGKLSGSDLWF